ncbi:unnamed protein product [Cyclocybe aegerita]|uniref:Uncharacterized protein n=1 Tax=Cyclocybe aegerita TaxID=1973307 RepID=A0A8S0WGZ2_CYCAE|nr:unnamed protein product [Cyclocybe aegerita]
MTTCLPSSPFASRPSQQASKTKNDGKPTCPFLPSYPHYSPPLLSSLQCPSRIQTAPKDDEQHQTWSTTCLSPSTPTTATSHPSNTPRPHKQPPRMMNDTKLGHSAAFAVVLCPIHPFLPFPPPSHLLPPPPPLLAPLMPLAHPNGLQSTLMTVNDAEALIL